MDDNASDEILLASFKEAPMYFFLRSQWLQAFKKLLLVDFYYRYYFPRLGPTNKRPCIIQVVLLLYFSNKKLGQQLLNTQKLPKSLQYFASSLFFFLFLFFFFFLWVLLCCSTITRYTNFNYSTSLNCFIEFYILFFICHLVFFIISFYKLNN